MPRVGTPRSRDRQTRVRRNHRLPIAAAAEPSNFFPLPISGLKAWYDFSDSGTMYTDAGTTLVSADGNAIYQISDKSGAVNPAVNFGVGQLPLYKTNIMNGKSVARFDGINDALLSSAITWGTPAATVFIVVTLSAAAATLSPLEFGYQVHAQDLAFQTTASTFDFHGQGDVGYSSVSTTALVNGSYILALTDDRALTTNEINGWVNGTPAAGARATNSNNTGNISNERFIIGSANGGAYWPGDLAEIIAFNAVLTSSQMNAVGNYLAAKWGRTWTAVS